MIFNLFLQRAGNELIEFIAVLFFSDVGPDGGATIHVKATDAFQKTVAIDSQHGAALNNLAHALAELGDLDIAEEMARRAVMLGGRHEAVYRITLEEILDRKVP